MFNNAEPINYFRIFITLITLFSCKYILYIIIFYLYIIFLKKKCYKRYIKPKMQNYSIFAV